MPSPSDGEYVVLGAHVERGFSPPGHPFLRVLLGYYGLRFHDLAPNSLLHVAAFIFLCEVYLKIAPSLNLWLEFFHCKKPCSGAGGSPLTCSNISFQLRPDTSPDGFYPEDKFVSKVLN